MRSYTDAIVAQKLKTSTLKASGGSYEILLKM